MKHQRIFIYAKDIEVLTAKSLRQSERILRNIKRILKKQRHQMVTIEECAHYFGIDVETIQKSILLISIVLKGNGV